MRIVAGAKGVKKEVTGKSDKASSKRDFLKFVMAKKLGAVKSEVSSSAAIENAKAAILRIKDGVVEGALPADIHDALPLGRAYRLFRGTRNRHARYCSPYIGTAQ